jgi:hypothetical protein
MNLMSLSSETMKGRQSIPRGVLPPRENRKRAEPFSRGGSDERDRAPEDPISGPLDAAKENNHKSGRSEKNV